MANCAPPTSISCAPTFAEDLLGGRQLAAGGLLDGRHLAQLGFHPGSRYLTAIARRKADLHEMVDRLPDGAVNGAAILLEEITDGRIDPEQAWFWTREWQAREREADTDLAAGRATTYESDGEFLGALDADLKPADPKAIQPCGV